MPPTNASPAPGFWNRLVGGAIAPLANWGVRRGWLAKDESKYVIAERQDSDGSYISKPTEVNLLAEYEQSELLYAAANARAHAVGACRWVLKRRRKGPDEVVKEHLALDILNQPFRSGKTRGGTWQLLGEAIELYLILGGKAYVEIVQEEGTGEAGEGKPQWLNILYPHKTEHKVSPTKGVIEIRYRPNWGRVIRFKPSEVLLFKTWDPLRFAEGIPPARPAWTTSKLDAAMADFDAQFFRNGCSPDAILQCDKDAKITDTQRKEIKNEVESRLNNRHSGRGVHFLPPGVTLTPYEAQSHRDIQFKEGRLRNREAMSAVMGVPPIILGFETNNYATAKEQKLVFRDRVVIPDARKMYSMLQPFLDRCAEVSGESVGDLYLDVDEQAMRSAEEVAEWRGSVVEMFSAGLISRDQAQSLVGLKAGENEEQGGRDTEQSEDSALRIDAAPEKEIDAAAKKPDGQAPGTAPQGGPASGETTATEKADESARAVTPFRLAKARDRRFAGDERRLQELFQKRLIVQKAKAVRHLRARLGKSEGSGGSNGNGTLIADDREGEDQPEGA